MYSVDPFQVFMYKGVGDWNTIDPYCFVSPMENDNDWDIASEKELYGVMEYPNEYMITQDVSKGVVIGFRPDSEYEFNINGQKLYRVNSNNICLAQEK